MGKATKQMIIPTKWEKLPIGHSGPNKIDQSPCEQVPLAVWRTSEGVGAEGQVHSTGNGLLSGICSRVRHRRPVNSLVLKHGSFIYHFTEQWCYGKNKQTTIPQSKRLPSAAEICVLMWAAFFSGMKAHIFVATFRRRCVGS